MQVLPAYDLYTWFPIIFKDIHHSITPWNMAPTLFLCKFQNHYFKEEEKEKKSL